MIGARAATELVRSVLSEEIGVAEIEEAQDGVWFRVGSAIVYVFIHEQADQDRTLIDIRAPVAGGVPLAPALYEHVALEGSRWLFGHLSVVPGEDERCEVVMRHTLLADHVDRHALAAAVALIARTVDEIDDDFVREFGGRLAFPRE